MFCIFDQINAALVSIKGLLIKSCQRQTFEQLYITICQIMDHQVLVLWIHLESFSLAETNIQINWPSLAWNSSCSILTVLFIKLWSNIAPANQNILRCIICINKAISYDIMQTKKLFYTQQLYSHINTSSLKTQNNHLLAAKSSLSTLT